MEFPSSLARSDGVGNSGQNIKQHLEKGEENAPPWFQKSWLEPGTHPCRDERPRLIDHCEYTSGAFADVNGHQFQRQLLFSCALAPAHDTVAPCDSRNDSGHG